MKTQPTSLRLLLATSILVSGFLTQTTSAKFAFAGDTADWVLGDYGEDCKSACLSLIGKECNVLGTSRVNSAEKMEFVSTLFQEECQEYIADDFGGEPSIFRRTREGANSCYYSREGIATTCDGFVENEQRFCCCGDDCPTATGEPEPEPQPQPEGNDWTSSLVDESCDQACQRSGGTCNADGTSEIDSADKIAFVATLVGKMCTSFGEGAVFGNEPSIAGQLCIHLSPGELTMCDATFGSEERFCCCGSDCPISRA